METGLPLSFGLVDGAPVFMDIAGDSYFRLAHDEECTFLASLKKDEASLEPIGTWLVRGSAPEEWSVEPVPFLHLPARALPGAGPFNPKLAEVLEAARLLLTVRRALRTSSIGDILERFIQPLSGQLSAARDPITTALAFRGARRLVPFKGNCLSDSLALIGWLFERGEGATLVFGVKLDPFAAHCWVQSGDVVLNDRPERVERFTPVRIIQCASATS